MSSESQTDLSATASDLPKVVAPRLLSLDLLRCVACLLVIVRHIHAPEQARLLQKLLHRGGWIGVDLFFVLSGFLVSGLLFREAAKFGKIDMVRFLLRRGLKIYPAFYFFVFVQVVLALFHGDTLKPRLLVSELLFVTNYFPGMFNHTWSLAVEEHFYILIVLVIAWLLRGRRSPTEKQNMPDLGRHTAGLSHLNLLPWILAAVALVLLVARVLNAQRPYSHQTHQFPTHLRLDALGYGVFLSYFWQKHREGCVTLFRPMWPLLLIAGVALLLPPFFWELPKTPWIYTIGYSGLSLGSALILLSCLVWELPNNLLTRGVAYVGSHSYSIYLWHLAVLSAVPQLLSRWGIIHPPIVQVASVVGCLLFGIVVSKLVEFPVLYWRDRWLPSRN